MYRDNLHMHHYLAVLARLFFFALIIVSLASQAYAAEAYASLRRQSVALESERMREARLAEDTCELCLDRNSIKFDTSFAYSPSTATIDRTLVIWNNTEALGKPRTINVTSVSSVLYSSVFEVLPLHGKKFPVALAAGQRDTLHILFKRHVDTTFNYRDTLVVASDDSQRPRATLSLYAFVQKTFSFRYPSNVVFKNLVFERTCPDDLSRGVLWNWCNELKRDIVIDSVHIPHMIVSSFGKSIILPRVLKPWGQYNDSFKVFLFYPRQPGLFDNEPMVFWGHIYETNISLIIPLPWIGEAIDSRAQLSMNPVVFTGDMATRDSSLSLMLTNPSTIDTIEWRAFYHDTSSFEVIEKGRVKLGPLQSTKLTIKCKSFDHSLFDSLSVMNYLCFNTQKISTFLELPTAVDQEDFQSDFLVYPNPCDETLNIRRSSKQPFGVCIGNALGETVFSTTCSDSTTIDVRNLEAGIYCLRLQDAELKRTIVLVRAD